MAADELASEVRKVLASARHGALATREADGAPFVSLVAVACDRLGAPLMLLSALARHTRNIEADPRVSLLVAAAAEDPMAAARLSVSGRLERCADPDARARFLRHHPDAEAYAGFADFALWRLAPQGAHFIAGFGRIHDLPASVLVAAAADDAAPADIP